MTDDDSKIKRRIRELTKRQMNATRILARRVTTIGEPAGSALRRSSRHVGPQEDNEETNQAAHYNRISSAPCLNHTDDVIHSRKVT